jgi:hypothetical protein
MSDVVLFSNIAYPIPLRSPPSEVVVRLKNGHCDPLEVKNIIYNSAFGFL